MEKINDKKKEASDKKAVSALGEMHDEIVKNPVVNNTE